MVKEMMMMVAVWVVFFSCFWLGVSEEEMMKEMMMVVAVWVAVLCCLSCSGVGVWREMVKKKEKAAMLYGCCWVLLG